MYICRNVNTNVSHKKKKLKNTFKTVRFLSVATPRDQKKLIKKGDKAFINCISECCLNVLKGNVQLTSKEKKVLKKHKNKLRALVNKKVSVEKKKKIVQTGGFLSNLLVPVAAFLMNLLLKGEQMEHARNMFLVDPDDFRNINSIVLY